VNQLAISMTYEAYCEKTGGLLRENGRHIAGKRAGYCEKTGGLLRENGRAIARKRAGTRLRENGQGVDKPAS
jgi:putative hemolysin